MAQQSVGLFLYVPSSSGMPARAVIHRRGSTRSEISDASRNTFKWGLQPLCPGPLKAGEEPLDALHAAIGHMFDTTPDIIPKDEGKIRVLSGPKDRRLIFAWEMKLEDVLALRIGACTGSVDLFFQKMASAIRPVSPDERDGINGRLQDAMLSQEHAALMNGFNIFG